MELRWLRNRPARSLSCEAREAAVLVPIIDRPEGAHLLLTKRGAKLSEHPGQMSFPGGCPEPTDKDQLSTAIREANEEIGLTPEEVQPVGRLDDIQTVSNFVVSPFVSKVPDRPYRPESIEVAEIAILPVDAFTMRENYECRPRDSEIEGPDWTHYFFIDGYTVWGATGRVIAQLLEVTTDWRPDYDV